MTEPNDGASENEEWEAFRAATTIDGEARAMGEIACSRTDERDTNMEDAVSNVVSSLLLKATTDDALGGLRKLNDRYSEAFYRGEANDEIVDAFDELEGSNGPWDNHITAAYSQGLQWAILHEMNKGHNGMREVVPEDWSADDTHGTSHHVCDCGNQLEWPSPEGCNHWRSDTDNAKARTWVCECGYEIHDPTLAEQARHTNGVTAEKAETILCTIAEESHHGEDAADYFQEEAWGMSAMNMFTIAGEEGYNPAEDGGDEIGRAVANSFDQWQDENPSAAPI